MFNFLNLGFEGYQRLARVDMHNARVLSRALEGSGYYKVVSEIHLPYEGGILSGTTIGEGVDAVTSDPEDPQFSDQFKAEYPHVKQEWMQTLLRARQWIVPNYALPPDAQDIDILRVVVRENVSAELIRRIMHDIIECTESLMKKGTEAMLMATVTEKPEDEIKREQVVYSKPC
ncbi:hypothetical protein FRB99_004648 [Tulasnella sp. 403]|nr:hypothetical protein FRB99_004648 [Tulasnella sp. 403]